MNTRELREHGLLVWLIATIVIGVATEAVYAWRWASLIHIHFGS